MNVSYRVTTLILALALLATGCAAPDAAGSGGSAATPDTANGTTGAANASVPQGRWVEKPVEGIPANLLLMDPPVRLDDGTLLQYARDDSTDPGTVHRLTSTDDGLTWQDETLDWAEQLGGVFGGWTARGDGTTVFSLTRNPRDEATRELQFWQAAPDGTLTQLSLPEMYIADHMAFLPDGTLALVPSGPQGQSGEGDLLLYDPAAGSVKAWVNLPDSGANIEIFGVGEIAMMTPATGADGTALLYVVDSGGNLLQVDANGTLTTVQSGFLSDPYNAALTADADGALCYADATGLYRQAQGGGLAEQLVEGSGTTLSLESSYISGLTATAGGAFLALIGDANMTPRLYRYEFDATVSAPTETLDVWSLQESPSVRAAVQAFTAEHPECAVNYEVALGDDAALTKQDVLRTLNTELLAGDGPDVLILDGTDLDTFTGSGLLADLADTVDPAALCDFVAEDYVQDDGSMPVVPARFSVPLLFGAAGSLDGVETLDDVAALVLQYPPRPNDNSWASLEEDQRYALGFESVDDLVSFALQTSQPAILTADGLDTEALGELLDFVGTVGGYYDMANYPKLDVANATAGNWASTDVVVWSDSMSEYAQITRARFGIGTMTTPGWLGWTAPADAPSETSATGQTILQPGLCEGAYLPGCFAAVSAATDQEELARAFVAALFSDAVQGSLQDDGMPTTQAGVQAYLDRNLTELQAHGYADGTLEALLDGLETPVVLDEDLLNSLCTHAEALLDGSESAGDVSEAVQADLALRFAERG